MAQIIQEFPDGFHADRALLLAGGEVSRRGNPAAAREMYEAFLKVAPSSDLLPKVHLAIARTYEQANDWSGAIGQYDAWLAGFTNHQDQARAEFFRAQANFQAGRETNALVCFTNFITRFPTNEFTPLAQLWVADYHFRHGNFPAAEMQYRSLFKSWPASELTCQAQMMAGRAAMARQGWSDAAECFTALYNETNLCPTDLRVQALFAYGDYWMSRDSTNKLADYREAISTFTLITRLYPTNRLSPLAWGQMALCYWQWAQAAQDPESVTNALSSFQQVIDSTQANASARSIAKVGIGVVLEQLAQHVEAGQTNLRTQALNHYLDVFYDKGLRDAEQPDLFWKKEAGLRAAHVAEELRDYAGARNVYVQLQQWLPFLRSRFENKINSLRGLEQAAAPPG
jgi:outer membrane protein assembly factor BamD (BamD/ComL family)